ncbi:hypothetical protein D3C87_1965470 [compost metagenome]
MKKTARIVATAENFYDEVISSPKKNETDDFDLGVGKSFHLEEDPIELSAGSSSSGSSSDGDGIE